MRRFYLIIVYLFLFHKIYAQVNLVIDPSFEIYDTCNYTLFIKGCKYWHSLDSSNNNVTSPTLCTPSYANKCSADPYSGLPNNYLSGSLYKLYPRTGNGLYINLFYMNPSFNLGYNRDYLRGRLTQKLINGKQYCGKYYVSLYKANIFSVDRLGAYLDDGSLDMNNTCLPIVATPYFENAPFNYITDTVGWTKIEGAFTANGTEQFVTIGNFYSNSNTHIITFNSSGLRNDTYFIVDDVSVIPIEIKAFAGNDVTLCLGDSIELGRSQEVGLDCWWYNLGNNNSFSSTSNFSFKPTQTGVFSFVQKMDNCQISFDTVNVTVVQDCNLLPVVEPIINIPNTFSPNGDSINDVWFVDLKNNSNVTYSIYNRWGTIIAQNESNSHTFVRWDGRTTLGEEVSVGVYYYVLEYLDKNGDKIKKTGYISLFK